MPERGRDFELTEPQRIFAECVEAQVKRSIEYLGGADVDARDLGLMFTFHEPDQVSVDGTLYDVLEYGHAEFGYGRRLYQELIDALEKAGWMMERMTGCDYEFFPL